MIFHYLDVRKQKRKLNYFLSKITKIKGDSVDSKRASTGNEYEDKAAYYLDGLGGKENIKDVTNCTTRLRLTVYDESKVADTEYFTHQQMAHGLVKSGKSIQVVVGMTVPQVREAFEQMVEDQSSEDK